MKERLLEHIVCPKTKEPLRLAVKKFDQGRQEVAEGELISAHGKVYPIINYIPRFVPTDDYVANFSIQWNIHKTTQLDNESSKVSEDQLRERALLTPEKVKGKLILDAGCGMGRFCDVISRWEGEVIGVDLSYSVDAADALMGARKNTHFIQADIFNLPFREKTFDFAWSFGVLMATPDCQKAFKSLVPFLKDGGEMAIWIYSNYNKLRSFSSDLLRKFTSRLPPKALYRLCYLSVPLYYIWKIPLLGHVLRNTLIISMNKDPAWRVLETFDWWAPKYQTKHRYPEVYNWFKESGFVDIVPLEPPLAMRGRKK